MRALCCAPVETGGCVIGLYRQHCVIDSKDVVGNDAGWLRVSKSLGHATMAVIIQ